MRWLFERTEELVKAEKEHLPKASIERRMYFRNVREFRPPIFE